MFIGPSLTSHEVLISRQITGVDAEGTPLQEFAYVGGFRGGFGSVATDRELVKGDAGQRVDAAVSILGSTNVLIGDKVNVSGRDWRVVGVRTTGLTTRILLAGWGLN